MNVMTIQEPRNMHNEHNFLDAANKIGMQLCRDALWHEDRCTWMGWAMTVADGNATTAYRTASTSLYDGVAGIALFLARLAQHAPSPRLTDTLEGAVRQVQARLADFEKQSQRSFYTGSLGAAYMLCEAGTALDRAEWVEQGLALAEYKAAEPFTADALDVIAGCASAIPALLYPGEKHGRQDLTSAAIIQAERLLSAGFVDAQGLSWTSTMPAHHNLLGYAHGVSGMAMALLEAYAVNGNEALLHGAKEALRYERSWFDAANQGWPDFRVDMITAGAANLPPRCNCTWCAGSTGIGLTRLRVMELIPDDSFVAEEVNSALQSASRVLTEGVSPQAMDLCLCHGLTGIADFVLSAGIQFERDDISVHAEQVGRFIIDNFLDAELPLPCGVQQRGEAPGLLLGKAGIGYFFLRLLKREKVPSILLLKT